MTYMNKSSGRLLAFLAFNLYFSLSPFCCANAQSQHAQQEITFKGTRLGVSEKQFLAEQDNQGYVCNVPADKVGRRCESKVATYAGYAGKISVLFLRDRLTLLISAQY